MLCRNEYLMRWMEIDKRKARFAIGLATIFLIFFAMLPCVAFAQEVGFLAKVDGKVDILRSGSSQAAPAMLNDTVSMGDVIRTKSGGKAEIHFIDNTILRLASGSRLRIDEYVFNPDKTRQTAAVTLFRGKLRAIVTKASPVVPASSDNTGAATFNIKTPTAVAGVLGTDLFVTHEGGVTGVLFKDGHGMVFNAANPSAAVHVTAGYVTFITSSDAAPLEPRPATDLELEQNVKSTTSTATDGAPSADASEDAAGGVVDTPIEIFLTEPPPAEPEVVDSGTPVDPIVTLAVNPTPPPVVSTLPAVTVTGAPASVTNKSTVNLTLAFTKPVTVTYILNGIGIVTPTTLTNDTFNVSGLAEGPQTLTITVSDADGNSSHPTVINWTTDYTAPVLSFTATPAAATNQSGANLGLSSTEAVTYSYNLDGASVPSTSLSGLGEGTHTFSVTATDAAGNASIINYAWATDYTAPSVYFVTTPLPVNGLSTADFSFASGESAAKLYYSIDSSPIWTPTWVLSLGDEILNSPTDFGEGLHTISIMSVDSAGNSSPVAAYTWFYGARQYDLKGVAVDGVGLMSASATGNLNLISTGTQGGWQLGLTGTYSGAPSNSIVAGGTATDGTSAFDGYWLDKIDLVAGTSSLSYLSKTVYGSGLGVVTGGYDGFGALSVADVGLGTYTETPLAFVSSISTATYKPAATYSGYYSYADIGAYQYSYDSGNAGYVYYYRPATSDYYWKDYYSNGTTYTYDYNTSTSVTGIWDPAAFSLSSLATPIDSINAIYNWSYAGGSRSYDGSINGLLGGTQSLWASASTPVTFMGAYSAPMLGAHIYGQQFSSYNYNDYTDTTYDNGAYYGYITGTEANGAMDSMLYALYVDPSGSVGYLKGALNGTYNQDIGMFEQDGTINKVQMAASTGITAADFSSSIFYGSGGDGTLAGSSLSGSDNGLYTMTLIDQTTASAQNWGLYYQQFTGQSVSPASNWTAKAGGYDGIGVGNPYISNSGNAYYADGGYYNYDYYSNNSYAQQSYYRPSTGVGYSTYYYSKGSTYTYNYTWGDPYGYGYSYWSYVGYSAGVWDTSTSLSILATPFDAANVTSSVAYVNVGGTNDYAYWLMDATGTVWSGDKLGATTSGRYLGHYSMGTLTGGLAGVYDASTGAWAADSVGIYESTPLAFSGNNTAYYYYYNSASNQVYNPYTDSITAIFGATQSPFALPNTAVDLYLMGQNNPSTSGLISWWGGISGSDYVDVNSKWSGWMAGTTGNNNIKGMSNALYIDANGNAGILSGDFIGAVDPDVNSIFEAQGLLTAEQKTAGYVDMVVYNPVDFSSYLNSYYPWGSLYGQFAGNTGYISSTNVGSSQTTWLTGQDWGIYKLELGGLSSDPWPTASLAFSMDTGGSGWKTSYDYWLVNISGNWNGDGAIDGTVSGRYLTQTTLGQITGNMLGSWPADTYGIGTWEGVALGKFTEQPLAFSGIIDYARSSSWDIGPWYGLMGDNGGYFNDSIGDVYGYVGGLTAPWSVAPVPVVYMGTYNDMSLSQYIWNDDIYSYNANDGTNTTYDNGAYHGFIGGAWNSGSINARVISLYVDPSGNAGYIKGSLAGMLYPELAMFEADGTWTATQMTTAPLGMVSADLYGSSGSSAVVTTNAGMTGSVSGAFNNASGYMTGVNNHAWTRYINGQDWGIYDLIINGYASSGYGYSNPNVETAWSAKTGGNANFGNNYVCPDGCWWTNDYGFYLADITAGTWAGGELIGAVNGRFMSSTRMGTITGDVLGYYDASGNWAATSLGVYEGSPLAHSGQVVDDTNWAGLYVYDQWGWLDIEGSATGIMGGVASPWSGTTAVTYMGAYSVVNGVGAAPPYLWTPDIYSWDVNSWSVNTFDNGMYQGFVSGVWKADSTIDAKVYSIYIDPAGNAGILKGGMTGAYYPDLNMFEADGQWTPTVLTTGLYAPTATVDVVSYGYGYNMTASGSFNGADSITVSGNEMLSATDWKYSVSGQDWGVSKSIIGGAYTGTPSDTWGLNTLVDQSAQGRVYGTMTDGTKWSTDANGNNVLAGATYGYGADVTTAPKTWISVGETYGTFDAVALTWQAAQSSAFIETSKYLAMMQTAEGQAALTQLNIPFVEVGNANLSGSGAMGDGAINVNMNNVAFLAYSNGAAPKLWATGDVNGGYTCAACGPANVVLTGNGISANFNVTTFDTVTSNNWLATVNGGGTYTGTGTLNGAAVQMTGAAAGIINTGTTTFTGTAAGVAQ